MGVLFASIALAMAMGLAAGLGLYLSQTPVYETQPLQSVRVGDPGTNLVGPHWTGDHPTESSKSTHKSNSNAALERDLAREGQNR